MSKDPTNQPSEPLDIDVSEIRIPAMQENGLEKTAGPQKKAATIPLPGLPNEGDFHDLRISALLKDDCYVTQNGLVRVQLELSEYPPLGWSYIFLTVWQATEDPKKARVGIEEDTLWVETEAADFKDHEFPAVQKAIEETNARFRQVLEEQIAAEAKREQLDRETLETILGLDLDLSPRPQRKRRNRWLRAYLSPLAWTVFSVVWILSGVWVWKKIPASQWSFIREPLLIIIWSWILYGACGRAISQFRHRYRIRKFVLRKRIATQWPDHYVDRPGRRI
jgi:hypothetical protein